MLHRALLLVISGVAALIPVLVASSPAEAIPTRVSLRTASTTVSLGDSVRFRGRVPGRSPGAKVVLQVKSGGTWRGIVRKRVNARKSFPFKHYPAFSGSSAFRVKVASTRTIRGGTSTPVVLKVSAPGEALGEEPVAPVKTDLAVMQAAILAETNEFRATHELPALLPMTEMNQVAQQWAEAMDEAGAISHAPNFYEGFPPGWKAVGENVAMGYAGAEQVVKAWMNSPGHRANLLGNYTHMGAGYSAKSGMF